MAIVTMTDAIAGTVALASEYNKVTANVRDLDTRVQFLELAGGGGVIGGEYRTTTGQTITASGVAAATKLTFTTAIQAASGITWNGTNQFTVVTAGVYGLYLSASMGFVGTANWSLFVNDSGNTGTIQQSYSGPLFGPVGQTNVFTSGFRYLAAGATICAYAYNNENAARTIAAADFRAWRVA